MNGLIPIVTWLIASVISKSKILPFGPTPPKQTYSVSSYSPSVLGLLSKPDQIVTSFMKDKGFGSQDYRILNSYTSKHNQVHHYYLRQTIQGKDVFNGDINLNIHNGQIISHGDSFYRKNGIERRSERQVSFATDKHTASPASAAQALQALVKYLEIEPSAITLTSIENSHILISNVTESLSDVKAQSGWLQTEKGQLEPVWDLQLELSDDWFHAHVSSNNLQVKSLVNWVAEARYDVYPIGVNDPQEGTRKIVVDPFDKEASPLGWHDQGNGAKFTDTAGNNAYAVDGGDSESKSWSSKYRVDGGTTLNFDFKLNLSKEPSSYLNASITNLFYWTNTLHDLYYRYGFDESAGNFQENNFGKGGLGNDAVLAQAQDGSGYNNANFATPPDGQRPRMRMYVWDETKPMRDGDLEDGIITHEYTHGVSIRLTGGPGNSGCLGWGEAGGMGEGWGDTIATMLRMHKSHNRTCNFGMGNYAAGGETIRKFPYSTSMKINPETYQVMDKPSYWGVHAKGEVWAGILYEVYWNLVDELGFTPHWFFKHSSSDFGNTLMLQLLLDGMKLQPCRPTFISARDAILQAERILTQGKYSCLIWAGFAKRGLGVDAKLIGGSPWGGGIRRNSFKLPSQCE